MIAFERINKTYPGGTVAVRDLTLTVAEGETLVLLGTSGSGKTTTMKMVNRLIEPTSGQIRIAGQDIMVQDAVTLRRGIGYAIQHIGLFPHMTVAENIAVVPKLLQWPGQKINSRIDELLSMVGVDPDEFRGRLPSQLSGGQKQRIGVARALAADPPVILMDEPFGALDPITREQLQNEFLDLESEIKKTIIFVTHDIFEAVKMGDRIALLHEGVVQQLGTPREIVLNPANEFVSDFLGHHRFQLSLLTKTIRSILRELQITPQSAPAEQPTDFLPARSTLIDALDAFQAASQDSLPVYDAKQFQGWVARHQLFQVVAQVMGEA